MADPSYKYHFRREMPMNLYSYHVKPEDLVDYDVRGLRVPAIALDLLIAEDFEEYTREALEDVIYKVPFMAYRYVSETSRGRWPKAEPYILKDIRSAYMYAGYVIKARWSEAEPLILTSAAYSYQYARNVIKARWSEAEPLILTDADISYLYTCYVVKDRWLEAEEQMSKDKSIWTLYLKWLKGKGIKL